MELVLSCFCSLHQLWCQFCCYCCQILVVTPVIFHSVAKRCKQFMTGSRVQFWWLHGYICVSSWSHSICWSRLFLASLATFDWPSVWCHRPLDQQITTFQSVSSWWSKAVYCIPWPLHLCSEFGTTRHLGHCTGFTLCWFLLYISCPLEDFVKGSQLGAFCP